MNLEDLARARRIEQLERQLANLRQRLTSPTTSRRFLELARAEFDAFDRRGRARHSRVIEIAWSTMGTAVWLRDVSPHDFGESEPAVWVIDQLREHYPDVAELLDVAMVRDALDDWKHERRAPRFDPRAPHAPPASTRSQAFREMMATGGIAVSETQLRQILRRWRESTHVRARAVKRRA